MSTVGLAAEETTAAAHDGLGRIAFIKKPKARNAKERLAEVAKAVSEWPDDEERHKLTFAMGVLESIREERNNASHPGQTFEDAAAIEDLLIVAMRHLPVLWKILA